MVCLFCGSDTTVKNSRYQTRSNQVWRRRQCRECQAIFTTHESADLSAVIRVNRDDQILPFNADLIFTELLLALEHRKNPFSEARELTSTVIKGLLKLPGAPVFDTRQISKEVSSVLERFDQRAWHRFSAEHPSLNP